MPPQPYYTSEGGGGSFVQHVGAAGSSAWGPEYTAEPPSEYNSGVWPGSAVYGGGPLAGQEEQLRRQALERIRRYRAKGEQPQGKKVHRVDPEQEKREKAAAEANAYLDRRKVEMEKHRKKQQPEKEKEKEQKEAAAAVGGGGSWNPHGGSASNPRGGPERGAEQVGSSKSSKTRKVGGGSQMQSAENQRKIVALERQLESKEAQVNRKEKVAVEMELGDAVLDAAEAKMAALSMAFDLN